MRQNTRDHLFSALAGFTRGVVAVAFIAVLDFGAIVVGTSATAISASAAAASIMPAFAVIFGGIALLNGPLSPHRGEGYENKMFTRAVAGLATVVTGIGFLLGVFFKPSSSPDPSHTTIPAKTPVENTKGVSFLNHENTFNAAAKNSKRTLALTAKDFSSVPVVIQKTLTV